MAWHDAYIAQVLSTMPWHSAAIIEHADCVVSQLEDGPIARCTFLRSARRIRSLHSISDSTSPHRDAFCDFALSYDNSFPSEYMAVSQWRILYG